MTNRIRNTAAQDPMMTMLEVLAGGPSGAVDRQEARGQDELVQSDVLPVEGTKRPEERKAWEAMGIVFGAPVPGDDLFVSVTLPAGWSKKRTDHAMWSDLVDEKGRKRAAIFYKAAFYDRKATARPVTRFRVERDYNRPDYMNVASSQVFDGDAVKFNSSGRRLTGPDGKPLSFAERDAATVAGDDECRAWLVENGYPDFGNPAAYWD